jgi:hypothetical protein
MKENELQPSYIKQCWDVGAVCGQVHVLDWLYDNGYKIERQIVHKAQHCWETLACWSGVWHMESK